MTFFAANIKKIILSTVIAIVLYFSFAIYIDIDSISSFIGSLDITIIILILALSIINYFLRYLRWQLILENIGITTPRLENFKIYMSGFALTATPGKAGELVRSYFLKKHGVTHIKSIGAFISERFLDLLTMVFLCLFGFSLLKNYSSFFLTILILILAISSFVIFKETIFQYFNKLFKKNSKLLKGINTISQILDNFYISIYKKHFFQILSLSVIGWLSESIAFFILIKYLGLNLDIFLCIFIFSFSMVVGAATFLPGGLGGTEATMIFLLNLNGVGLIESTGITIFIRLATLWFAVVLGIFFLSNLSMRYES